MWLPQLLFLLLSVIQGYTEVFPISSSGHLAIATQIFSFKQFNLALAAGLHGGSLIAIAYFFRLELASLWQNFSASLANTKAWLQARGQRPFKLTSEQWVPYRMVLTLLPLIFAPLFLESWARRIFTNGSGAPLLLGLNGLFILITGHWSRGERKLSDLSWKEFLLIGILQNLAVLPGISRLGLVLCLGLWRRLNWYEALRLAFLLAIPVIFGAALLETPRIIAALAILPGRADIFLFGFFLTIVCSYYGLKFLMASMLERRTLFFFGYYCLMMAVFSLTYLNFWVR